MMSYNNKIDFTNLRPNASLQEIKNTCLIAIERNYATVCIHPCYVKICKEYLKNSNTLVCTVVGFPLGQNTIETKVYEAKNAIDNGADEIDLVINISKFINHDYEYILNEINAVKDAIGNKILKVIVETGYLDDNLIIKIAELILLSKADFIKTSTGFGPSGANINHIIIWKKILGNKKKIKAAGGIKSMQDLVLYINAGCERIGTSTDILKNIK